MDGRACALSAVLAATVLAGCQGPRVAAHIDTVNAEYRQLEDYVYCLEDENLRLQQELDHVQAGNQRVRAGEPAREGIFRRPARPGTGDLPVDPGAHEPPKIELPDLPGNTPPRRSTLNKPAAEPLPEGLELAPPSLELPAPAKSLSVPADGQVTHITLSPLLTGGTDLDGRPGDDGLSVVIEPRNAAEEYVPQAGAVSIVVLDPTRQGEAARVARWDFDLSTTRGKLQTSAATRGIALQMPWPATAPTSTTLHLFVRFETPDGRRLAADREIYVAPLGQASQRWTPRPPERQRPAEVARGGDRGQGTGDSSQEVEVGSRKSEVGGQESAGSVGNALRGVPPAADDKTPATPAPSPPKLLQPPPALSGSGSGGQKPTPAWSPYR